MRGKAARFSGAIVLPAARTLYFDGSDDENWFNLANWWNDASHTDQATILPKLVDSVIVTDTSIDTEAGSEPAVANFTLTDTTEVGHSLFGPLTVTGIATFNGLSNNTGTLTGNAVFNDDTFNSGTVVGDATFNDDSVNAGAVTGTATFNDSSCNDGGTAGTFVPNPPPEC
jgi:hypothetical protein